MSIKLLTRFLFLLVLLSPMGCAHWAATANSDLGQMTGRGLSVTLGRSSVPDQRSMFNENAFETLDQVARYLNSRPYLKVLVEGHADTIVAGREAYHYRLSEARAQRVREALERRGVASDRIHAEGLGDYMVASMANRGLAEPVRVEIVMSELTPRPQTIPADWVMERVRARYPHSMVKQP